MTAHRSQWIKIENKWEIGLLGFVLTHFTLDNRHHFPTIFTLIDGLTARPKLSARTRHTRGFGKMITRGLYKRIF